MCAKPGSNRNYYFLIAIILGLCTGYFEPPLLMQAASTVSEIFINLFKLVSLPIIFLSIISTASSMEHLGEIRVLGQKVIKYTLLTTIISATVALLFFLLVDPVQTVVSYEVKEGGTQVNSYLSYLVKAIPSNIMAPFVENNVIGVLFLAILLSFAILSLPPQNRSILHSLFSSLYAAITKITKWIIVGMPLAIWAFITLFLHDFKRGLDANSLALYLVCVVGANLVQAFIVLPTLLRFKGISPINLAKAMSPALSVAFFTKSSSAALPTAMKCAEEKGNISPKVSSFAFPLCTSINMNGCAAFILITVLFVSMSQGIVYTPAEMFIWIFISTIAAIGNAGVPMGCYFLASAFLAAMNVPLNILGVILPFYSLIDMLETSINVWSDSCVAAIVQKEVSHVEAMKDSISSYNAAANESSC